MWNHFFDASIAQATTAAAKTIIAISSTMSDIPPLEKQVADLNRNIAGWNKAYVWALGIALIVGAFPFWAQRQAIWNSRKLVITSGELSEEKDRQLRDDLGKANERAAKLEKEAAEARTKQAIAEKNLQETNRLAFMPRYMDEKLAAEILDAGPKGSVEIQSSTTQEATDLAVKLRELLTSHGWTVASTQTQRIGAVSSGITILFNAENWQYRKPFDELQQPILTLWAFLNTVRNPPSFAGL